MKSILVSCCLLLSSLVFSQGDDCSNALYLNNVNNFCSGNGAYTNAGSTPSGYSVAACWAAGATSDVWFYFIATGTEALGSIAGTSSGGTMVNPRVAVYSGTCGGTLTEVACATGSGTVQFFAPSLVVGQTYWIRVSTNATNRGTFKLCINNYTPANNPGADCGGATKLCAKTPVGVGTFSGPGSNAFEPPASSCMSVENNSVWYYWTCGTSGTLTFDITPVNGTNDIDFVLFQLNTASPCGSKTVIRCNTSSCTPNNGMTGISASDADATEDPGCDPGENAYCSQITMTAGTSYALLIDNANANAGFNLSFGGTGTFQGPNPVITPIPSSICAGQSVTFDGTSSTNVGGGLTWTLSNGTISTSQPGPGPFTVPYSVPGNYVAILEGIDNLGCHQSQNANFTVNQLPTVNAGPDQSVCAGTSVTLSGSGASSYSWDNGVTNGVAFTPAATQTYTVTGTDVNGCQNTDQVTITIGGSLTVNAGPDQSICTGQSVTLTGSGASNYSWDNGVSNGVSFTPLATTTYTLTGDNGAGCSGTDQVTVTVNALPAVNAGTDQTVCNGQPVTLSGSGATSYSWNNGVTNGSSFTPASTQTYTLTGTDGNGCQNTDQVVVTVNALPVVNAGTDQTVCNGQSVTLSGSGASTYSWNNGVTNGASFTPSSTQTYTVTGTSAAGCQNTDQVVVTVNPLPTVNAGTDQTICAGQSVTLTGSGASTYTWNNGVTNGVAFTPGSTQTYTVTGTSAAGCQSTDQVIVTVNPLPNVNAGTDQTVCAGQSVTLSGSGASTYSWNNGVTNGSAFTPASTQTYTVTGTSAAGCQSTDQVTITVNALPPVNAGTNQAICAGQSCTLSGSGATSYTWNNGVTNGTAFTPASTQTYTVTGTDGNGCQNTDQVTVTVNALPNVNAGADINICQGTSVTLTGSGASTYTWSGGVVNNQSFTQPIGQQSYSVTGTDANGCTNTDQITVTVLPQPVAGIFAQGSLTGAPGLQVTFGNSSSNATTFNWDFDNGNTENTNDNTQLFTQTFGTTGTYTVVLTASNGICQDTAQIHVYVVLPPLTVVNIPNVFTPDGDNTNDHFFLTLINAAELNVRIVNRWGNVMSEFNDVNGYWDGKTQTGEDAETGVYFFTYIIKGIDGVEVAGQGIVELFRKP